MSSQILLIHFFLLIVNLPNNIGFILFVTSLFFVPLSFWYLRELVLFYYSFYSPLAYNTDLGVYEMDYIYHQSVFIQSFQLQSSKVSEHFINGLARLSKSNY